MIELSFISFIQLPQLTFFVGQDEQAIVVHAAAVAATSHQLDALINGGLKKSKTRCAKIEVVRVDDFIRFCEYAYRGITRYLHGKKTLQERALSMQRCPLLVLIVVSDVKSCGILDYLN